MDVRILDNADMIAAEAGEMFASAIKNKPGAALGLATGATPLKLYGYLISKYRDGEVSFKDVRTYNLDEYLGLPGNDANSYRTFMRRNFFDHVDIQQENTHIPDGCAEDIDAECRRYDKLISDIGGVDIQLLGLGTDGHIGFNEPADSFSEGTCIVKLLDSTIRSNSIYFEKEKMPLYAVTMGVGTIMSAKKIVIIAVGEKKAAAVRDMILGEVTPRCPASILQTHPDATVFLDKEAAAQVKSENF